MQLMRWGEKEESGNVLADRNRMIQLVADEFRDKRLKLYRGTRSDWHDYWLHWSHIYRVWETDALGVPRYQWLRDGRDDWVHATVYWRIGIDRFGTSGAVVGAGITPRPNSYMIDADQTVTFDPADILENLHGDDGDDGEWR